MPLTYAWDDATIDAVKEVLQKQLDFYATSQELTVALGSDPPEPAVCLARALQYHMRPRPGLRDPGSVIYGPMFEFGGQSVPEPVGAVSDDALAAWADALELFSDSPLVVSRIADLLWLRRHGPRSYAYAESGQAALRGLWTYPGIADVDRADCLARALDLIYEANLRARAEPAIDELVSATDESLSAAEPMPGVCLRLLTRIVDLPARARPSRMAELLQTAERVFAADPFSLDAVLQLRLRLAGADPAARRAVAQDIVAAWMQAAEDAAPLIATRHLEQALSMARANGLGDEARQLLVRLQELSREDQGLAEFSTTVSIPAERVEASIAQFLQSDEPRVWLRLFGHYCPVTADREEVARQVRRMMNEAPLQFLMTHVKLNDQNLPLKTISGDEEQFAQAVRDHDTRGISFWSLFAARVLDRILADERTTDAVIGEFLESGVFDTALAHGLVRAFRHYAAGDYEEALLCAIPRLEAALRLGSMELGLVVYTEPGASKNGLGSYRGLGELLMGLVGRAPEQQRAYLMLVLTDPLSINLRNRALHGLMEHVTKEDAALALHAAAVLGQWQRGSQPGPDAMPSDSGTADSA